MTVEDQGEYRVSLGKEDFKFSAAHFTLFSPRDAERLHGHNYQVVVDLFGPRLDELGLLVDIRDVKGRIRSLCARLDERTLIPSASDLLDTIDDGEELEIRFAERRYRFPQSDIVRLPIANITIEALASWLWSELAGHVSSRGLTRLRVTVGETSGQSASFESTLERGSKSMEDGPDGTDAVHRAL